MKHINEYIDNKIINEGLLSWLKAFIKKVKNNQFKLVSNTGQVNMLKMDVNKLQIQKEPASFRDIIKDRETVETWNNKKIGFPILSQIAKNANKYIVDTENAKSEPLLYTFYYNGDNTYYAGVILYDNSVTYIDNYLHIIDIEANLVVDNPSEVIEAIFNQFKNIIYNNKKSISGFTAKENIHPKFRGILNKLKFKESEIAEIYKLEK